MKVAFAQLLTGNLGCPETIPKFLPIWQIWPSASGSCLPQAQSSPPKRLSFPFSFLDCWQQILSTRPFHELGLKMLSGHQFEV